MPPPTAARIPLKLHRHVSLIRTADAALAEELLARKGVSRLIAGRLDETILLVHPGAEETILDELRRMGHTPQVVR
jgi:hypothetical protein